MKKTGIQDTPWTGPELRTTRRHDTDTEHGTRFPGLSTLPTSDLNPTAHPGRFSQDDSAMMDIICLVLQASYAWPACLLHTSIGVSSLGVLSCFRTAHPFASCSSAASSAAIVLIMFVLMRTFHSAFVSAQSTTFVGFCVCLPSLTLQKKKLPRSLRHDVCSGNRHKIFQVDTSFTHVLDRSHPCLRLVRSIRGTAGT